jgi:hypothetical protein
MDKGLIGLMVLSGLVALLSLFKYFNIVPASVVWGMIQLSLVYITTYTIYTMVQFKGRVRRRNARRGNTRPPRANY